MTQDQGLHHTEYDTRLAAYAAVVDDNDESPADQRVGLFHGHNRICRYGQRRSHSKRRSWRPLNQPHCAALPRVTSTVCGLPEGSR